MLFQLPAEMIAGIYGEIGRQKTHGGARMVNIYLAFWDGQAFSHNHCIIRIGKVFDFKVWVQSL